MSDIKERIKNATPKEFYEEILVQQFEADASNADKLEGFDCVIQFKVTGDNGGEWAMHIKDKTLKVNEESHPEPSMTMELSYDDWKAMNTGELNPQQAFMEGRMVISGDMSLAMQLGQLMNPS